MLLGHWQELKALGQASGALDALAALLPDDTEVIHGSMTHTVPVAELQCCFEGLTFGLASTGAGPMARLPNPSTGPFVTSIRGPRHPRGRGRGRESCVPEPSVAR